MKIYQKLIKSTFTILSFLMPILIFADTDQPIDPNLKIKNPLAGGGVNNIYDFIQKVLEGAIKIGMPILVLAVIYSGFLFVMAQGKPEEINKAKTTLLYTLIGGAILLGSWAIAQIVSETILAI